MHTLTVFTTTMLLLLITKPNTTFKPSDMGMDYYIVPNKPTTCKDDFPSGLSFFFEQVGGYDDKAEVEQISKILDIDLSVFQDVEYDPEDKLELEKHWHNLDTFTSIVDTFIAKLKARPDYYKEVHHNPNRDKQLNKEQKLWRMADTIKRDKQLEELHNEPFYYYPPDVRYLSEGKLLKELQILKRTIDCYKRNGVTKVRLEYM